MSTGKVEENRSKLTSLLTNVEEDDDSGSTTDVEDQPAPDPTTPVTPHSSDSPETSPDEVDPDATFI